MRIISADTFPPENIVVLQNEDNGYSEWAVVNQEGVWEELYAKD